MKPDSPAEHSISLLCGPVSWTSVTGLTRGTDVLRAQHTEIIASMNRLGRLYGTDGADPLAARNAMTALSVLMTIHLAMEKNLFVNSEWIHEPKQRNQILETIEKIEALIGGFMGKYPTPSIIASDPLAFIDSCQNVLSRLGDFFAQEEAGVFSDHDRSTSAA